MQIHYPIHSESHPGIHKKKRKKKKKRTCTHYHLKKRKEKKVELNRLADNLIAFFVKNFVYWQKVFTVVLWELTCLKSSLFGLHTENGTLAEA